MSDITFLVEDPGWRRTVRLMPRLKRAARTALAAAGREKGAGVTVLLSSDARLNALNRDFRGKDKPTNVLSFPAAPDGSHDQAYLGDIAIAYGVTRAEAKAGGKTLADHAAHLVVHGVLHLMGYDHERARDAKVMEPLEVRILAELGIADPYAAMSAP